MQLPHTIAFSLVLILAFIACFAAGECGVPYERRIRMPTPSPDEPWYSFDWGPIHFLQYSTEHAFERRSKQYDFIVDDLHKVDRRR